MQDSEERMSENQWVIIAEYATEMEAKVVEGRLRSEGISCRVTCDDLGGQYAGLMPAMAFAKLYTTTEDQERAESILKTLTN